jgi:pSer/pThr/pTyr-binding forkhead associated (FHA) protein
VPRQIWLTLPDGIEFELGDRLAIGRAPENDLALDSKKVSREHALVAFRDGRWFLEDRGSYNGTFLNGTRLQPGVPRPEQLRERRNANG